MFISSVAALVLSAQPDAGGATPPHPTIEAEAEASAEVYRVRMVDGYGRELPLVAFARRAGQSPSLEVTTPHGGRLTAVVREDVWNTVRSGSVYADRTLTPLENDSNAGIICLHAWSMVVEMANTETSDRGHMPVRKASGETCNDSLARRYAFQLVDLALDSAVPCEAIKGVDLRPIAALGWCADFQGDRLAAASLFNQIHETTRRAKLQLRGPSEWKMFMGVNSLPVVEWLGEVVRAGPMDDTPFAFVSSKAGASSSFDIFPRTYGGTSSRETFVTGVIQINGKTLAYTQKWVWDPPMNMWKLEYWTVSDAANEN